MRRSPVRGALALAAVSLMTASTAAAAPTTTSPEDASARYTVEYAVKFNNGGEWGDPEPYGHVYLQTKDNTEVTLWYQQRQGDDTPSVSRYPSSGFTTKNIFFSKDDIDKVCAYVDEYDVGNPDDKLAAACNTFTGTYDDPYTIRGGDSDSSVQVTVKRIY